VNQISSANITAAALTTQVFLLIIMGIGAAFWYPTEDVFHGLYRRTRLAWIILTFTPLTLLPLIFSVDFAEIWRPLLGNANIPGVRSTLAIFLMFSLDIVCVAFLIGWTGGSRNSPFSAIYFILPALAIFLREPFLRITLYTSIVILFFVAQLIMSGVPNLPTRQGDKKAFGLVSVFCVLLTTVIGYVTRPR